MSDEIDPAEFPLLPKIGAVRQRISSVVVVVVGHTKAIIVSLFFQVRCGGGHNHGMTIAMSEVANESL